MNQLEYICGVTFAPFAPAGSFATESTKESLRTMKENTNANFVILVPNGLQETPQSEEISYTSPATMTDDELKGMIEYAHSLGLRVALKPTANCKNGTWRAHRWCRMTGRFRERVIRRDRRTGIVPCLKPVQRETG